MRTHHCDVTAIAAVARTRLSKMHLPLRLIIITALVAGVCHASQLSPVGVTTTFSLRSGGGSSPDDPALVAARITTAATLAQGMLSFYFPRIDAKIYGTPNIELPMVEIMSTGNGSCLLSVGMIGSMLFFGNDGGSSSSNRLNKALALSYLPFSVSLLRNMLTGIATKVQQPMSSMWFGVACNTGLSLAVLTESKYGFVAATIWSVFIVLNGCFFIGNPQKAVEAWGVQGSTSEVDLCLMQAYGFLLCSGHLIVLALIYGMAPTQAFGYGTLCLCAMFLKFNLLTKETQKLNLRKGPQIFWTLLSVLSAAAMLVY